MLDHESLRADDFRSSDDGSSADSGFRAMPDIARKATAAAQGRLDRVGMSHVEMPVLLLGPEGRIRQLPAVCDAFVSLDDPTAKGIHMSRLFLALQDILEREVLSPTTLDAIVGRFIATHHDLSASAHVAVRFDWMRKRNALMSDHAGWRTYPVEMFATRVRGTTTIGMRIRVTYSSTCPCSAALARQLIQEQFDTDFGGRAMVDFNSVRNWLGTPEAIRATPHSQRSHADVLVHLDPDGTGPDIDGLIDRVEGAIRTVVQAAVKREDEQAFALLNGQNLMFCEDAARIIRAALDADARIRDYHIRASHFESLHPHDAVAIVVKGVPNGLRP
jgi:GTP cyclohydrolase I